MRNTSVQHRFLIRASVLVITSLLLWWWTLNRPLLSVMRTTGDIFLRLLVGGNGSISEDESGGWTCRVPMEIRTPNGANIHSVDFTVSRSDALVFTFSLPIYWALALAARSTRTNWRRIVGGTITIIGVETLALLLFALTNAHAAAQQWRPASNAITGYPVTLVNYFTTSVLPFLAPILVLIIFDHDLRREMFRWESAKDTPRTVRRAAKAIAR